MIDINKQYKTRNGLIVRIYATDGVGDSVHGAVLHFSGWQQNTWSAEGKSYCCETLYDLIEVRPRIKRSYWVNLYPSSNWTLDLFDTREKADGHAGSSRVACVRVEIDCEHGEGL